MSQARFHISALTMMLFGLSASLDSGKGDDITLEEIKDHASEGDLIPFLYKATDEQFDMGYCKASPEFCQWYLGKIKDLCEVMAGNERRKYGIENRGICLLISYTAEIIQQGEDIRLEHTR